MPWYEYRCSANGTTLEVRHGMGDRVETWGELAARAGVPLGTTAPDEPVERLLSAPVPFAGADEAPGCGAGCACRPHN